MKIQFRVRSSGWLEVIVARDGEIRFEMLVSPAVIQLVVNIVLFVIAGTYSYIHGGQFPTVK